MGKTYLYIGNRRVKDQERGLAEGGIARCEFYPETGRIVHLENQFGGEFYGVGKGYVDKTRRMLYATDEREDHPGLRSGGGSRVLAFSFCPEDGALHLAGQRPSYGSKASYLVTDPEGKYLLVTNHGGRGYVTQTVRDAFGNYHIQVEHDESNVVLFPLDADGVPGEPVDIFRLTGSGPKPFQKGPHAHSIAKAPGANLYAVCDKGGDQVWMFRIDYTRGQIVPCEGSPYHREPGAACRYSAFHPILPLLYINMESAPLITSFQYDGAGRLTHSETVHNYPDGQAAPPTDALTQSDLCIDQTGRHMYAAVRIFNVIQVYDIHGKTGGLTLRQTFGTAGGVRMCCLSPDGRFLLASFPAEGQVQVYPVGADGELGGAVCALDQPAPATLNFFEA